LLIPLLASYAITFGGRIQPMVSYNMAPWRD